MDLKQLEDIANRKTTCHPFGETVSLSRAERDQLVAMARHAIEQLPEVDFDDAQDWAKTYPAIAWHLIYRHGENWAHTGVLMERWARAWVAANPQPEIGKNMEKV